LITTKRLLQRGFERAYQVNASQPGVIREASTCAMELGRRDDGSPERESKI